MEVLYTRRPVANYLTAAVETVLALHRGEGPGDVLVFLTGQEEVEQVVEQLRYVLHELPKLFNCLHGIILLP